MKRSPTLRQKITALVVTFFTAVALSVGTTPASAWYDNRLPKGCWFWATPSKPYLSGGRIHSKVTFNIYGCNGRYFWRTHGISDATYEDAALPIYRWDTKGVVPNYATISASGKCRPGYWATTISISFTDAPRGYGFAQSEVLHIKKC